MQSNIRPQDSSAYTELLNNRDFRSPWFGQILSQLAVNTLLFVLALRIYQTTASNTAVSGLFMAYGIPAVLFGLLAGTVVDRLDKKRILVVCDIVRGIITFLLLFSSHNLPAVYLFTFISAIITQFYVPSEAPLIPKLVPARLLVSANSLFSLTFYSSLAIGSVLSGPLFRIFGQEGIFVFLGALFIASTIFSSRLPSQSEGTISLRHVAKHSPHIIIKKIMHDLAEGIRYMYNSAQVFDAIILLTGTQIIFSLLGTLGPGFADKVLLIDYRDASLYIVGPVVIGILGGVLWVGSKGFTYTRESLIRTGILCASCSLLGIAAIGAFISAKNAYAVRYHPQLIVFEIALFLVLGIANSLLDVPANSNLQEHATGSMRGRVYGMLTAFVGGVGILPVVIGGFLADVVGIINVLLILGSIIGIYGLSPHTL